MIPPLQTAAAVDVACARLSSIVYGRDWTDVDRRAAAIGYTVVGTFDHAGSEAMLAREGGGHHEILVFRGTEATTWRWRDILANVGVPSPWAGQGCGHTGYSRQLNRILWRALDRYMETPTPTLVTGHSMGGALATLFAALLEGEGRRPPAALVSFGAPRAIDRVASEVIACPVRRYVVAGDPAPLWPPVPGLVHPAPAIRLPVPASSRRGWRGAWPWHHHDVDSYAAAVTRWEK